MIPDKVEIAYRDMLERFGSVSKVFAIDKGYSGHPSDSTAKIVTRVHVNGQMTPGSFPHTEFIFYTGFTAKKPIISQLSRRSRLSVIQPGISIGTSSAGTLGLIGYDGFNSSRKVLLTCHHVIADSSANVIQPAPGIDRGHILFDLVAFRIRIYPPGDASIAELDGQRANRPEQFGSGAMISNARSVNLGDLLEKSGRTTGITRAVVDGIGTYYQSYPWNSRKAIEGFRLVPLDPQNPNNVEISDEGDSGAVWYDPNTFEGVGLQTAGERSTLPSQFEFAVAQHLEPIIQGLNFSFTP